jgi:hypothetical protein
MEQYADRLEPLLKTSAYNYAANLSEAFEPQRRLLSEHNYDESKAPNQGKPAAFNNTLLVTINFPGTQVKIGGYTGSMSAKFFDDFMFASLSQSGINIFRYGSVRLLAWVPQAEKDQYIPRTVFTRTKLTVGLEACSRIVPVAMAPYDRHARDERWADLEREEFARIDAQMRDTSLSEVPEKRQLQPPPPHLQWILPKAENLRGAQYSGDAKWVQRFLDLETQLEKEDPEFFAKRYSLPQRPRFKTAEQREWATLRRNAMTQYNTRTAAAELVIDYRKIITKWKVLQPKDRLESSPRYQELLFRTRQLHHDLGRLSGDNLLWAQKAIDDCRSMDLVPPILSWSQRSYNPLVVSKDDFAPATRNMALLDITPRSNSCLHKLDTTDKLFCYRHVMNVLTYHLHKSVAHAFKLLVHDTGVEEFAKTVEGVHDLSRGGWFDLTTLRLRGLPADLFVEIALAYERWPFRPSVESLLMTRMDLQAQWQDDDDDEPH